MSVKPIPEGYHTATAYLIVRGAAEAIEFYERAFGASEILRMEIPGGGIAHAEIKIGDSPIMLADEVPEQGFLGPVSLGGTPVTLLLYVEDVDAAFARAIAAGATMTRPIVDQFYGDRSGMLKDPFGHLWTIATHKEDLTSQELQKRMDDAMKGHGA